MKKIEKILKYIEDQGLSKSVIERDAKLGNSYFINTKKRGEDISLKMLEKMRMNVPDVYFQIFPEERENATHDKNHNNSETIEPHIDLEKLKTENELLKSLVESKQSEIESLKMVIEVLKEKKTNEVKSPSEGTSMSRG